MATDADRKLQQRLQNHRIALGLPRAASLQEEAIETWFLLEWTLDHLPPGLAERALASLKRRKARRAKAPQANAGAKRATRHTRPAEDALELDEEALERDFDAIREAEQFHGGRDPFTGGL